MNSSLTCSSALSSSSLFIEDVSVCPCVQNETNQDFKKKLSLSKHFPLHWTDHRWQWHFKVWIATNRYWFKPPLSSKLVILSSNLLFSGERYKRHFYCHPELHQLAFYFKAMHTYKKKKAVLYISHMLIIVPVKVFHFLCFPFCLQVLLETTLIQT